MSVPDEQKIKVTLTVRGDCGRPHASVEEWQQCRTCGAILEYRLNEGRTIRVGQSVPD